MYKLSLKICNLRYILSYKHGNDFAPKTMLSVVFYYCLFIECSYMGFKSLHTNFQSEKVLSLFNVKFRVTIFKSLYFLKYCDKNKLFAFSK